MTVVRIAMLLPGEQLGQWSWNDVAPGRVAASGTHGQALALAERLSSRADVVLLPMFLGGLPADAPTHATPVGGLASAAVAADEFGADALLFVDHADEATQAGVLECDRRGLRSVAWAQNGPYRGFRELFAGSPSIRRVVCVSQPHADLLRHTPLFDKVAVINNALLITASSDQRVERSATAACFLGATVAEKGFHHLVRAWPVVRAAVPAATLTVFGSARLYDRRSPVGPLGLGSPEFEAEFLAPTWGTDPARLAADHGVLVAGLTRPADLAEKLRALSVAVVNPSVSRGASVETFCVSAIEAEACGCAVVGGRRLGLTETVLHGRTGVLIRDEDDLGPVIVDLMNHPERTAALGSRGQAWAPTRFSAAAIEEEWMALFRDVAADRRAHPPRLALQRVDARTAARQAGQMLRRVRRFLTR
jgi:glycosyltransferase involved in cell wall biosynthesis